MDRPGFTASLVAGGVAGVSVDLILFPLDTIKTRLQSPQGFDKAGGFRGIYAGIPSAALGSFPNAAAFFITYEYAKWFLHADSSSYLMPVKHMLAASAGEVYNCRVVQPTSQSAPEHLDHPERKPCAHGRSLSFALLPSPGQPANCFLSFWICLFRAFYVNGILQYSQGFSFFHSLTNTCYFLSSVSSCKMDSLTKKSVVWVPEDNVERKKLA